MSLFAFNGRAEIKHFNARKEGPEEDKILALDIKLLTKTDSDALRFFDEELVHFLYLPDSGAVRNLMLEPIKFKHEVQNCELLIAGCQFHGVRVSKFQIEAADGWQLYMTWQCSFLPSRDECAILAEYLQEEVEVCITAQPDLFDDGEARRQDASEIGEDDPLFSEACQQVMQSGKASISFVQRQLRIGYNRAARLIEGMEGIGLVTPMRSDGNREVVSTR